MANYLQDQSTTIVQGLGTWTFNVLTAGLYQVSAQSTMQDPASGLIITINQNGSAVSPSPSAAPSPVQQQTSVQVLISAAANDVITIVLSSSNAVDQLPNDIKTILRVSNFISASGQNP